MSKVSAVVACTLAFISAAAISTGAVAQLRDPSIPAGTAVLSGTPSGTYGGGLTSRTVPPIGYTTSPSSFGSCGGAPGCGPTIVRSHRSSARGRF